MDFSLNFSLQPWIGKRCFLLEWKVLPSCVSLKLQAFLPLLPVVLSTWNRQWQPPQHKTEELSFVNDGKLQGFENQIKMSERLKRDKWLESKKRIPEQQCGARWKNFAQVEIFWEQSRHLQIIVQTIFIVSNMGSDISTISFKNWEY